MASNELKNSEILLIKQLSGSLQQAMITPLEDIAVPHLFMVLRQNDDRNWHINDNYILSYCLTGSKSIFVADRKITLDQGEAIILPANIRHRFCTSEADTEVLLFSFCATSSKDMISKISGECFLPQKSERKNFFNAVKIFGTTRDEFEASLYFAAALNHVIKRLFPNPAEKNSSPEYGDKIIQKANMIIQKNLQRRVSLNELARQLNVSVSTLQKTFYAKMKCGVGRYALNQRLTRASKLLRSTDMSIGEIAFATGFESETTFRRALKRESGYSPNQIRKISHGIIAPGIKLKSNGFPVNGKQH